MNPILSGSFITDNLFSRMPSHSMGPICRILKPNVINISVFNNYNRKEGVECKIDVFSQNRLIITKNIGKNEASSFKIEIPNTDKIAYYTVTIYSRSKYGKKESKENLGIESGISQSVVVFSNQPVFIRFGISRKESILHNFLMEFAVEGNSLAKGKEPIHELESMSDVAKNGAIIASESTKQGVDADIVKAIMYMETTHGYYDVIKRPFDKNMSLLPMNVRSDYWKDIGFSRRELKKIKNNISAGIFLIKMLSDRVKPYSIEGLASLYQDLGATKVTEYGARVKKIYDKKLWFPEPSILEKIEMEFNKYDRLSPTQQVDLLERIFGGFQ